MLELHDARNGKSFRTGIKARSVFARTSATLSGRYCRLRNYNKSMNSYRSIILYRLFKSLRRQGIELRIQDQGSRARSTLGTEQNSNCVNNVLRTACLLYIWGIQSQAYENSGSDPSALQDPRPGYFRTCKSVAPTEGKQNTV